MGPVADLPGRGGRIGAGRQLESRQRGSCQLESLLFRRRQRGSQQLEIQPIRQRSVGAPPGLVIGAPLGETGRSQDRLGGKVVTVRGGVQTAESEPTVLNRLEGVGDDWSDRLTDDAPPSGARSQPVAELALEAVLDRTHPEDLDVSEHRVGCHVGDAPVQVRPGVHVPATLRQPGREVIRPGLGAGWHEAQAVAVRSFTGAWSIRVAPWAQPESRCLEHRRLVGRLAGGHGPRHVSRRHGVFGRRRGRVSHHRLA